MTLGASLLAARIGGADIDEVLVDITSHTPSVGLADEDFLDREREDLTAYPVIPRDTVVPVERTQTGNQYRSVVPSRSCCAMSRLRLSHTSVRPSPLDVMAASSQRHHKQRNTRSRAQPVSTHQVEP